MLVDRRSGFIGENAKVIFGREAKVRVWYDHATTFYQIDYIFEAVILNTAYCHRLESNKIYRRRLLAFIKRQVLFEFEPVP